MRFRLGDETLELTEYLNSNSRPIPVGSRSNDRWFQHIAIIVSDMDKAFEVLRKNKVRFASTAPQGGKPFPDDTKSSDLWHWQMNFVTDRAISLADVLLINKYGFVSSGVVSFSGNNFDYKNALLVRDTDGHAVRVIER